MGEVRYLTPYSEKKARQFESWVSAQNDRYVVFFEEHEAILKTPHPRILSVQPTPEVFQQLARQFIYLPVAFENPNHPLLQQVAITHCETNFRAFDFADQGLQLLQNIRHHLSQPTRFAKDLYGKFQGTTAIICGGGPSLSADLKKFQDKALIIGCGAGVEALLKMGIKPHFAAHVDPAPLHKFTKTDIPLFYQLRTSAEVTAKYTGPHFLVSGTGNFPLEGWIQKKLGLEESFDGGWTVGTFGVALAALLGCDRIILAGIDLATSKGQLYAPGVKTTSTAENFLPMKNRDGEEVFSRPDWVFAAEWLNEFGKKFVCQTLSAKGLAIPSIPLTTLQDFSGVLKLPSLETPLHSTAIWQEIAASFTKVSEICRKILQEMETIFPKTESGTLALLEHDLTEELAYTQVLEPLWQIWQHVISRHNQSGAFGLILNRILFFQSVSEKLHAV